MKLTPNETWNIQQKLEGGWGNPELKTKPWKSFGELEVVRVIVKEGNGDTWWKTVRSQMREQTVEELSGGLESLSMQTRWIFASLESMEGKWTQRVDGSIHGHSPAIERERGPAWSCLPQAQPQEAHNVNLGKESLENRTVGTAVLWWARPPVRSGAETQWQYLFLDLNACPKDAFKLTWIGVV